MSKLGDRLKYEREKRGWSQVYVAQRLNMKRSSTYANWEYNLRQPDAEMITKLAELYEVSTDYLLGLTKDPSQHTDKMMKDDPLNNPNLNIAFYDGYDELSPEEQEAVKEIVKNTIETFKKMKAERIEKKK